MDSIHNQLNIVGFILLIGVAILLLVLLIFWMVGAINFNPVPKPPAPAPPNNNVNYNFGQSTTGRSINVNNAGAFKTEEQCNAARNTIYTGGVCSCTPGFFGANCNFPMFSPDYYILGQSANNTDFTIQGTGPVSGVSFVSNLASNSLTASEICNQNPDCVGFKYHNNNGNATFYTKLDVKDRGHFFYDTTQPGVYFGKTGQSPHFVDRVFLLKGPEPLRYWLLDRFDQEGSQVISLLEGTVYKMDFLPEKVVNVSNLTGIYSQNPMDYNSLDNVPGAIIVKSNDLPPQNLTLPYYVAYVKQT